LFTSANIVAVPEMGKFLVYHFRIPLWYSASAHTFATPPIRVSHEGL